MARRGRRIANALTAGAALAALALVLPSSGPAQQLEVEITECGSAAAPSGCASGSQKVRRDRGEQRIVVPVAPKPRPAPKPAAAAAARGAERHDVDLKTGEHRVRKTDGSKAKDPRVEVEVDEAKRDRDRDDHGHDQADVNAAPDPKVALDPVTTTAGSPFAGFGSGMELVSTDEALSRFAIPPFLVPIYVAAGRAYDVPWNLLAAINQIETDFGRIGHQVSTAGALGWMQFMPATWKAYGVDASGDGIADPYNPVDAIYAAARYLRASGAPGDLRRAVFAYNHADWYVDSVLKTAGVYGSLPDGLVAETGSIAFGRFPVLGRVSYGDDFRRARAADRPARGLTIEGEPGAAAIATQQVSVQRILLDRDLARAFRHRSVPRRGLSRSAPSGGPVTAGRSGADAEVGAAVGKVRVERRAAATAPPARRAAPARPAPPRTGRLPEGFGASDAPGITVVVEDAVGNRYRYGGLARVAHGIRPGVELRGGRKIGRLASGEAASLLFSVRAAGGAAIDPRPLVDGYRLQEVADFQHAVAPLGGSPFVPAADEGAVGGTVSGTQSELARRVLDDAGIDIYPGGRQDVARGIIDRRVLGALLYLRRNGLEVTVTSLRSGHSFYTAGGSVSAHSFGAAVDIAAFNGQPVLGNQGPGSLTEQAVKLLMRLEGDAQPAQLITLMNLGGPSFAMSDHDDHLHVGYHFEPSLGLGRSGDALGSVTFDGGAPTLLGGRPGKVQKGHERALAGRLGKIENPSVRGKASSAGVHVEAESADEGDAARRLAQQARPLRTAPTAAGARVLDVDVPAGARGDEAYALGTVAGTGRGWAEEQVVVLAHRSGAWRVVGPPRDAHGDVADPKLVSLATVAGGRGFAVGRDGSVVELRGSRAPVVVGRPSRSPLTAVAVRREAARVVGVAVGARGTAVDLASGAAARSRSASARGRSAATARTLRAASRGDRLTAVSFAGDSAVAVGERASGGPLVLRRAAGGWHTLEAPAERGHVSLTSVAGDGRALWVAGGIRDGGGVALPFAARYGGSRWETFCAPAPALAAVRELGEPTRAAVCDRTLPLLPGTHGPAGDVDVTGRGVVLSTTGGIELFDGEAFRPLPAAPGTWPVATTSSRAPRLALLTSGSGWATGAGGRIARVTAAQDAAGEPNGVLRPAALTRGAPAAVAAAPGGGRALALSDRAGALGGDGGWADAPSPQVPLRDLDFRTAGDAWGVAETGELLRFDGERWSGDGDEAPRLSLRLALGGGRFATAGAPSGLAALAFRSAREGYAAGAGGAIARFDGLRWTEDRAAEGGDLLAVAASERGVVAGGTRGVVLERTGHGWERRADAEALAAGRDVTAAAALDDGTLLVAAGSALLVREAGRDWRAADVAPAGIDIRKLAAVRSGDGALRAIALAGPTEAATLLVGDRHGWRPVTPGGLDRIADFDLDPASGKLWATGFAAGRAGLASVAVEDLGRAAAAAGASGADTTASGATTGGGDATPGDASQLVTGSAGPRVASGDGRRVFANPGPSRFESLLKERGR